MYVAMIFTEMLFPAISYPAMELILLKLWKGFSIVNLVNFSINIMFFRVLYGIRSLNSNHITVLVKEGKMGKLVCI